MDGNRHNKLVKMSLGEIRARCYSTLPPQPPTTGPTKLALIIPTTCDGRLHKKIYHGLKTTHTCDHVERKRSGWSRKEAGKSNGAETRGTGTRRQDHRPTQSGQSLPGRSSHPVSGRAIWPWSSTVKPLCLSSAASNLPVDEHRPVGAADEPSCRHGKMRGL